MDDETLLAAMYRGRPTTIVDVARLSRLTEGAASAAVGRLRDLKIIGGTDESVSYVNPADWLAHAVTQQASELRRDSENALARLEKATAGLPDLLRQWAVGESSSDIVPVQLRHGPSASEDLWYETVGHDSGTVLAVLPDVGGFFSDTDERAARFAGTLQAKGAMRVIVPTAALRDPDAVPIMARYGNSGVEFRVLDDAPSWFWVDGDHLALPFEWGEEHPTSVLGIRSSVLAALAGAYFQCLWERADPIAALGHPWTPLLLVMRQGVTLDSASRIVGVNPRTGRRRISMAMKHYGVSTLFALGVAWAADSARERTR